MLLRLTGFLSGHPGVTPALCRFIAERLNDGWYPVVPASRPGTAGETIPLCHLFQTFIGEGDVLVQGRPSAGRDRPRPARRRPYELQLKEGLALVNGARWRRLSPPRSRSGRSRCSSGHRARRACRRTRGSTGAALFLTDRRLKAIPAAAPTRSSGELLAVAEPEQGPQAPVSLRVLPQVHGAARDQLDHLLAQLERELRAVTDSPLYLEAEGDEPEVSTRAATSIRRRCRWPSTRSPSRHARSRRSPSGCTACSTVVSRPSGAALLRSRARTLRPRCPPQGDGGVVGREPAAGGPGVGPRRRHLLRPGGLPGLHGARRRPARAAAGQPRAGAGVRARSVAPGSRASSRTLTALDAGIDTVASRSEAVPSRSSLAPDVELARGLIRSGELTAEPCDRPCPELGRLPDGRKWTQDKSASTQFGPGAAARESPDRRASCRQDRAAASSSGAARSSACRSRCWDSSPSPAGSARRTSRKPTSRRPPRPKPGGTIRIGQQQPSGELDPVTVNNQGGLTCSGRPAST